MNLAIFLFAFVVLVLGVLLLVIVGKIQQIEDAVGEEKNDER